MKCNIPLNWQILFKIDVTPEAETRTMALISEGLKTGQSQNTDNIYSAEYWSGQGYPEVTVTGAQNMVTLEFDRRKGDPAQDYILGTIRNLGCGRVTYAEVIQSDGTVKKGNVTIANVTEPGGGAVEVQSFSAELHFQGKPDVIAPAPALTFAPNGVVLTPGTVAGNTSIQPSTWSTFTDVKQVAYELSDASLPTKTAQAYSAELADLTLYDAEVTTIEVAPTTDYPDLTGIFINVYGLDEFGRLLYQDSVAIAAEDIATTP